MQDCNDKGKEVPGMEGMEINAGLIIGFATFGKEIT